jgi:hypothetical protein
VFRLRGGGSFAAGLRGEFQIIKWFHTLFLSLEVERTVAANGEKPLGQVTLNFGGIFGTQPEKGVLHHVAGAVEVARDLRGVAHQRAFMLA